MFGKKRELKEHEDHLQMMADMNTMQLEHTKDVFDMVMGSIRDIEQRIKKLENYRGGVKWATIKEKGGKPREKIR